MVEFQFNMKALKVCGFSIPTEIRSSLFMKFWSASCLIPYIVLHILVFVDLLDVTNKSLYSYVLSAFHLLSGTVTLFRFSYFIIQRENIAHLINLLNEKIEEKEGDRGMMKRLDKEMRHESTRHNRRYSIFIFAFTVGTVIVLVSGRILSVLLRSAQDALHLSTSTQTSRFVLYMIWWPTNIREIPTYYFIISWQCFSLAFYLTVYSATDAFTCSLLLSASARADMLARAAPRALQPNWRTPRRVPKSCRAWIIRHQQYLKIVAEINHVAGPLILVTHVSSMFTCIALSFIIFKLHDGSLQMMIAMGIISSLIQLAFISTAGQKVIDMSNRLARSVVYAAQVEAGVLSGGRMCSSVQVIATRLFNERSRISGLGFFTVSMEFFLSVLSASMTYILFLLQIKSSGGPLILDNNYYPSYHSNN